MSKCPADLRRQLVVQPIDQVANVIGDVAQVQTFAPSVSWIEDLFQILDRPDDHVVIRQWTMPQVIDRADVGIRLHDSLRELGQLFFHAKIGSHEWESSGSGPEGRFFVAIGHAESVGVQRQQREPVEPKNRKNTRGAVQQGAGDDAGSGPAQNNRGIVGSARTREATTSTPRKERAHRLRLTQFAAGNGQQWKRPRRPKIQPPHRDSAES